jgi:uncharacterized OB-fold protein
MTEPLVTPRKPLPKVDELNGPFWQAAREHRLVIQRCDRCDRSQYPAVESCPACGASLKWVDARGTGVLHTYTVFHQVYHPAFADAVPYNVSIVELPEGPLILTNVVECENADLRIGMPLEVVFDDVGEGVTLPKFRPVSS